MSVSAVWPCKNVPVYSDAGTVRLFFNQLQPQSTVLQEDRSEISAHWGLLKYYLSLINNNRQLPETHKMYVT